MSTTRRARCNAQCGSDYAARDGFPPAPETRLRTDSGYCSSGWDESEVAVVCNVCAGGSVTGNAKTASPASRHGTSNAHSHECSLMSQERRSVAPAGEAGQQAGSITASAGNCRSHPPCFQAVESIARCAQLLERQQVMRISS